MLFELKTHAITDNSKSILLCVLCHPVLSDSLWPHGLYLTRLLCSWDFTGKHTGVGCRFLPQRTYPTQRSHLHLLCLMHWLVDFLPPCHLGSTFNNFLFGPSTLFFFNPIFFFSFDSASTRLSNVSFIGIIPYYYAFEFKSSELVKWMKLLSCVWLFVTPWTVACQGPPSMGFSRQEYWHGLQFPSPGDLPEWAYSTTKYGQLGSVKYELKYTL